MEPLRSRRDPHVAEGGKEIKIKVGNEEYKQKIGPLRQYNDYRFEVHIDEPGSARWPSCPPTGCSIWWPSTPFGSCREKPTSRGCRPRFIGKQEEYRNALYVHSPATVTFEVPVPKDGRLHFGMGITEKNSPVTFRVMADSKELYSKTVADVDAWEDADVDLSSYGGRNVKLTFETSAGSREPWACGLIRCSPQERPRNGRTFSST